MRWRPPILAVTGILWLGIGIGRFEHGGAGFLLVTPFLIALFSLLAALLWWTERAPPAKRS